MSKIKSFWNQISISRKLYLIFGFMAVVIVFELLALKYSMQNLQAVRAFVYGESVWSKAQKDSVHYLNRLAMTKDEADFRSYEASLFVPHECRPARLELYKENPDMDIVRKGFINGKIHPDDVDPILHMIRNYAWLGHIKTALSTWKEADEILQQFEQIALKYRDAVLVEKDQYKTEDYLNQLHQLNIQLGEAEDRFSHALQEGARWLEGVILLSLVALVITVELTGFLLIFFLSRSISLRLNLLIDTAKKIGDGTFPQELPVTSEDEIGKLTRSINQMGRTIQSSQGELERKIEDRTSQLREVARENELLYEEAKRAVKTRDEFFSIASHELKTPITALQLSLQLIEKNLVQASLDKEWLSTQISKSLKLARKLTSMQDTLMDVTSISGGHFQMHIAREDLVPVIKSNIEDAKLAESSSLVTYSGPDTLMASFDSTRIGQVVTNLVRNGLKYGNGLPVEVSLSATEKLVRISVTDQGSGIPSSEHEKVFERFIRVNTDNAISGLGMGLYISRQIMEAHKGSLVIEKSDSRGTKFVATFPIS